MPHPRYSRKCLIINSLLRRDRAGPLPRGCSPSQRKPGMRRRMRRKSLSCLGIGCLLTFSTPEELIQHREGAWTVHAFRLGSARARGGDRRGAHCHGCGAYAPRRPRPRGPREGGSAHGSEPGRDGLLLRGDGPGKARRRRATPGPAGAAPSALLRLRGLPRPRGIHLVVPELRPAYTSLREWQRAGHRKPSDRRWVN